MWSYSEILQPEDQEHLPDPAQAQVRCPSKDTGTFMCLVSLEAGVCIYPSPPKDGSDNA